MTLHTQLQTLGSIIQADMALAKLVADWLALENAQDEVEKLEAVFNYGTAAHLVFQFVGTERLLEGVTHAGHHIFIDRDTVGMPLAVRRIQ